MGVRDGGILAFLTDDELARLMDQAGRYGLTRAERIKWKAVMALLINYGPRVSEAMALRWDQVDFASNTITFPTFKKFRVLPVRAARLLRGEEFGRTVARRIAGIIGLSAEEVLTWQGEARAEQEAARARENPEGMLYPAGV